MERIRNFLRDKSGATGVEYGLLVALIGIACAAAIGLLGINLAAVFTSVNVSAPAAPAAPAVLRLLRLCGSAAPAAPSSPPAPPAPPSHLSPVAS